MITLFMAGTVWFWVLLSILAIIFIAVQENSNSPGSWTTFGVIATFVLLYYTGADLGIKDLGLHIYHNPGETIVYFLVYVVAGILWSFFEWRLFVNVQADRYQEGLTKDLLHGYNYITSRVKYQPQLNEEKSRIFNWIFYWPFSLVWFCIHEPVQRIFDAIMRNCKKIYEGITERAFNKVKVPTSGTESKDLVQ